MATLDELYSYDIAIETAWRDTLRTLFDGELFLDGTGNQWTVGVHMEQSDEAKVTPFVDVQLRSVVALDHKHIGNDGVLYFDSWEALLVSRVCTQRGLNSDVQAKIIGLTRAHAANFSQVLGVSVLPFHDVEQIKDHGLHRGLIIHEVLDYSEVLSLINFSIRPSAWTV